MPSMTFAHNALILGLVGLTYYHVRLLLHLRDRNPDHSWLSLPVRPFWALIEQATDRALRRTYQKLLNGYIICLIYVILAAVFAFWP